MSTNGTPRDMDRAEELMSAVKEEALQTAREKAHKPHWVGTGLRERLDSIMEEADETCMALAQMDPHKPHTILHARREIGNLVWSAAIAGDDSGVFRDRDSPPRPGSMCECCEGTGWLDKANSKVEEWIEGKRVSL